MLTWTLFSQVHAHLGGEYRGWELNDCGGGCEALDRDLALELNMMFILSVHRCSNTILD